MVTTSTLAKGKNGGVKRKADTSAANAQNLLKMAKWAPRTLPPHADDSDKSILPIKKLNHMTSEQVHTFIDIPGLDMNMFERLKKLDFQNWAGACPFHNPS